MCAGGVDDPPDGLEDLLVRMHYFGMFVAQEGLLEYADGLVVEFPVEKANLDYETILSYAQDMYHVERGHCRDDYSYKLPR